METSVRKFIISLLVPLLVSLGLTNFFAQTPSPSPSPTPPRVALKAGRLLDVKTGRIATNVFIFVENHRITSVGPEAPAGVPVIDLSNAFVMPGMVDCHAHILGNLRDLSPGASLRMSSPKRAIWGARNLRVWLDKGFTTLRDAGEEDMAYGQLALRDAINEGLIEGPRMQSAGSFISVTGGHGDADFLSPIKPCRADRISPTPWMVWRRRRGSTSNTAPIGSSSWERAAWPT